MARDERVADVVTALAKVLVDLIYRYDVTEAELRHAIDYVTELGKAEQVEALSDAFGLSTAADNVTYGHSSKRTESNIPGPFYRAGAPMLSPPYRLVGEDESGEALFFRGSVRDGEDGTPVGGALLDVWQANAAGLYENQDSTIPDYHLRGQMLADADGAFELRTVVPGAYEIPNAGPVGVLLDLLGRHAYRPRHIHVTITREDFVPLTTQIYFEGDEFLDSDSIGAAKPELVAELHQVEPGDPEAVTRGVHRPFFLSEFQFRLAREHA
jgi:protocatechuate 3,4-dioxygenase beta subunit